MKKKMSLENRITLAQNNAIDFTHACVTIALHEVFGLGRKRLEKVDKRRSEVNGEVLRIMAAGGRAHGARRNAEAWLRSRLPKGTPWELLIPNAKGVAKTHTELKIKGAVDEAATLEWRVYAVACAEVLGFSTERLIRLYDATMDNYRQLNQWVLERAWTWRWNGSGGRRRRATAPRWRCWRYRRSGNWKLIASTRRRC